MIRKKASTLLETLLYCTLFLLVIGVAYMFYLMGLGYLTKTRVQIEMQQANSLAVSRLITELAETNLVGLESFPNPANPNCRAGLVLVSARDDDNRFRYGSPSARPVWQRYVSYYLESDPQSPGSTETQALFRAELETQAGVTLPGEIAYVPSTKGITTDLLATKGTNRKLIAHGLLAPTPGLPHGGFNLYGLSGVTRSYTTPLSNPCWLEVSCKDGSTGSRANSMLTRVGVMVRN